MKRDGKLALSRREWLMGATALGVSLPMSAGWQPARAATTKYDDVREHLHHLI